METEEFKNEEGEFKGSKSTEAGALDVCQALYQTAAYRQVLSSRRWQ
jgi:hypothetical protein